MPLLYPVAISEICCRTRDYQTTASSDCGAANLGVDVGAATFIRQAMIELAAAGSAVVIISQDLEEIFSISNRIAVLSAGRLSDPQPAAQMTAQAVGLLMGGVHLSNNTDSHLAESG